MKRDAAMSRTEWNAAVADVRQRDDAVGIGMIEKLHGTTRLKIAVGIVLVHLVPYRHNKLTQRVVFGISRHGDRITAIGVSHRACQLLWRQCPAVLLDFVALLNGEQFGKSGEVLLRRFCHDRIITSRSHDYCVC